MLQSVPTLIGKRKGKPSESNHTVREIVVYDCLLFSLRLLFILDVYQ